jgi:hypothetical protein
MLRRVALCGMFALSMLYAERAGADHCGCWDWQICLPGGGCCDPSNNPNCCTNDTVPTDDNGQEVCAPCPGGLKACGGKCSQCCGDSDCGSSQTCYRGTGTCSCTLGRICGLSCCSDDQLCSSDKMCVTREYCRIANGAICGTFCCDPTIEYCSDNVCVSESPSSACDIQNHCRAKINNCSAGGRKACECGCTDGTWSVHGCRCNHQ